MKNNSLAVIYDGIINKKRVDFSKTKMPNSLRRFIEKTYEKAKKVVVPSKDKQENALLLVLFFNSSMYDYKATSIINKYVRDQNEKDKVTIIDNMLKDKTKPFYMASWHKDSARDHKDYQGKLYYDESTKDEDVLEYAREHDLKSLQWVTGKPVWFVTRPYCRHYFTQHTLEEVKKGVKPRTRKVGDRALQTPPRVTLEYYLDRLDQLERLYRVFKIPKLKIMIDKTKLLIKKWKKEI